MHLLPALPVDEIRKTGSTAVTEATDAASRSAPASSMEASTKVSRKSSNKTISKSAQGATEPHSALWLVFFSDPKPFCWTQTF